MRRTLTTAYLLSGILGAAITGLHQDATLPVTGTAVAAQQFTHCTSLGHGMTMPTCGVLFRHV